MGAIFGRSTSSARSGAASPQGEAFSQPINRGDRFYGQKNVITTRCWGSAKTPPMPRSKAPTASWPKSTTRTRTPAIRTPRKSSRRSMRPTMCFPTRTSASAMTSSALPGSIPTMGPASPAAASVAALAGFRRRRRGPGRHLRRYLRRRLWRLRRLVPLQPQRPPQGPGHPGQRDPDL